MKKIIIYLLICLILFTVTGCNNSNYYEITEILDGSKIFEVNYNEIDYEAGDKFWSDNNDNWEGGCTAVSKELSNGHRVIGRNMDLNIADKPAYIIRTNEHDGKYKTLGLAYTYRDYAPMYDEVKNKGISDEFRKILPFLCDDVMNDQGLHIEVNMRHGETDFSGNDLFSLEGTNPNSEKRIHMFELPRYIAENCKTVQEAKEYVKTLDIYSKSGYWNYCFIISDSMPNGDTHTSLLEFSQIGMLGDVWNELVENNEIDNKKIESINWIDEENLDKIDWIKTGVGNNRKTLKINAITQANFFVNWWDYQRQDIKSGEGRFNTIQSLINDIDSTQEMYDLMRRISYSWFYTEFDNCYKYHFDPRSENIGEFQEANYSFLFNEEYFEEIKMLFDLSNEEIRQMTRKQKEEKGGIWESTFTEVVDLTEKFIEIRFFEDEDLRFKISFDSIEHLEKLDEPVYTELPELSTLNK